MAKPKPAARVDTKTEYMEVCVLRPHPRNYREHPDDQLAHICESIEKNGIYRNVVIAKDGTILAGHGVVKAAQKLGIVRIPVVRLPIAPDDPMALKVLAGDNEISHLGVVDDRALSELLKEIADKDLAGLLGTGYDAQMLANLVMVTRPESEIADFDAAAQWVGMPEYENPKIPFRVLLTLRTEEDVKACAEKLGIVLTSKRSQSSWWPPKAKEDRSSVKVEG